MDKPVYQKRAFLLTLLLVLAAIGCLLWILLHGSNAILPSKEDPAQERILADIYQNGRLLESIPLKEITDSYRFTVSGENEAFNEIEVRPGSIGIVNASCPDKLCVNQGFIDNSLLPVTCLPNRLVIQIRVEEAETINPDISTY